MIADSSYVLLYRYARSIHGPNPTERASNFQLVWTQASSHFPAHYALSSRYLLQYQNPHLRIITSSLLYGPSLEEWKVNCHTFPSENKVLNIDYTVFFLCHSLTCIRVTSKIWGGMCGLGCSLQYFKEQRIAVEWFVFQLRIWDHTVRLPYHSTIYNLESFVEPKFH